MSLNFEWAPTPAFRISFRTNEFCDDLQAPINRAIQTALEEEKKLEIFNTNLLVIDNSESKTVDMKEIHPEEIFKIKVVSKVFIDSNNCLYYKSKPPTMLLDRLVVYYILY